MTLIGTSSHVFRQLENLKLAQLQRLAVSLGTSCSGTKPVIRSSIEQILPRLDAAKRSKRPLSLISIDMGIRNLAYAHLKADLDLISSPNSPISFYQRPQLRAWEKIAVASSAPTQQSSVHPITANPPDLSKSLAGKRPRRTTEPESFTPSLYASHAVTLISSIIATHNPTHILIERQRFRSGGSPIVQDWSIRVGVFEGMLYAVLRTLAEKCDVDVEVEGVEPAKVNRYWLSVLDEQAQMGRALGNEEALEGVAAVGTVPKGKVVKKMKIDVVARALEESREARKESVSGLEIDDHAVPMVDAYLSKLRKDARGRALSTTNYDTESSHSVPELSKLDDLADCLLQGMAWIDWENNRARLAISEDV